MTGTRAEVGAAMQAVVDAVKSSLIVPDLVDDKVLKGLVDRAKYRIVQASKEVLPAGVLCEVVEEDEDTLLVREIMEEPDEEIRLRLTLPFPVDYISLTVRVGK